MRVIQAFVLVSFFLASATTAGAEDQGGGWRTIDLSGGRQIRYLPPEVRESDYPASVLRDGIEGRTVLNLVVSPAGQVIQCTVRESSGSADLDRRACEIYRTRGRFQLRNFTSNHHIAAPVRWRLVGSGASAPVIPSGSAATGTGRTASNTPRPAQPGADATILRLEIELDRALAAIPSPRLHRFLQGSTPIRLHLTANCATRFRTDAGEYVSDWRSPGDSAPRRLDYRGVSFRVNGTLAGIHVQSDALRAQMERLFNAMRNYWRRCNQRAG